MSEILIYKGIDVFIPLKAALFFYSIPSISCFFLPVKKFLTHSNTEDFSLSYSLILCL